jgi:hypothetical protein
LFTDLAGPADEIRDLSTQVTDPRDVGMVCLLRRVRCYQQ